MAKRAREATSWIESSYKRGFTPRNRIENNTVWKLDDEPILSLEGGRKKKTWNNNSDGFNLKTIFNLKIFNEIQRISVKSIIKLAFFTGCYLENSESSKAIGLKGRFAKKNVAIFKQFYASIFNEALTFLKNWQIVKTKRFYLMSKSDVLTKETIFR